MELEYDYDGEINALWAVVRAMQQNGSPPVKDEWPEFVHRRGYDVSGGG